MGKSAMVGRGRQFKVKSLFKSRLKEVGEEAISVEGKYKAEGMASAKALRLKHAWCAHRSVGRRVTRGSNELAVRGMRAGS